VCVCVWKTSSSHYMSVTQRAWKSWRNNYLTLTQSDRKR